MEDKDKDAFAMVGILATIEENPGATFEAMYTAVPGVMEPSEVKRLITNLKDQRYIVVDGDDRYSIEEKGRQFIRGAEVEPPTSKPVLDDLSNKILHILADSNEPTRIQFISEQLGEKKSTIKNRLSRLMTPGFVKRHVIKPTGKLDQYEVYTITNKGREQIGVPMVTTEIDTIDVSKNILASEKKGSARTDM